MNIIHVNLRTIPEINQLFAARANKKDSFKRWFNRWQKEGLVAFHADGTELIARES